VKIHEYQARELIASYGVPVNPGDATDSPEEARRIAERAGLPVMVKAQVLTGGRGKAGGVKKADTADEAESLARKILAMSIKGYPVTKVLIVRALPIYREHYLGITVDRTRKRAVLILSASGGVDIEELAVREPGKILTLPIDPLAGLDPAATRKALAGVVADGVDAATADRLTGQAVEAVGALYRLFREKDCSLVEVNPYALTGEPDGDRHLAALDAKITFDDNALYLHPEIEAMRQAEEYAPEEIEARQAGLSFVGLDGEIGCIVNGAGLAMATMDLIELAGGTPANFLDVGGSSNPQKVLVALRIILRNPRVKAILINIFGGITRCDDIAQGILLARKELGIQVPLVIRLIGTNEVAGRGLLQAQGLEAVERLGEAVEAVIRAARGTTT
jgi:succinyl-CoA synthetase beta subunit